MEADMTWSRGFTDVTFSPQAGQVTVSGDTNEAEDTIDDRNVVRFDVAMVAFPDGGEILSAPVSLGLKNPWRAIFHDVKAPFDHPGQQVFLVGMAWVKDPIEHFIWQQTMPIGPLPPSESSAPPAA
jgi:hypothetical protein